MEQRSLRLGDNVDDYCPRERRVTGHVIVAIVGEAIRQTRCAACDAEHEYKEARVPRKKMKNGESGDLTGGVLVRPAAANGAVSDASAATPTANASSATAPPVNATPAAAPTQAAAEEANGNQLDSAGETLPGAWIGHRPLIRATLPKTENDVPPPRAIPEFTMHQRQGRGFGGRGAFRHGGFGGGRPSNGAPGREANGNGPDGNRAPGAGPGPGGPGGPGAPGGRSRHRRRHRRPR